MDAAFKTGAYPAYTLSELREFVRNPSKLEAAAETAQVHLERITAEIARREAVEAGDVTQATPAERLRAIRETDAAANTRLTLANAMRAPITGPAMAWKIARTQAHLHVNGNYSGISVSLTKCRPDDALIASMNLPPLPKK